MTDLCEKYILLFISKHYEISKNRETIYHRKHTVSPEIIIFYKGNMLMEFQTKLLHGKAVDNYANGSTVPPISLANAFAYESSEQLEKVFQNRAPGFAYTRIANPTVDAFERRVNELEGGIGGVACSSGMSAVTLSLLNILQAGDEVIAGSALFGGTLDLLHDLEAFGIKVHFIPRVEKALIEPFLTDKTRAVFGEIVGNPALNVMDVRETADFLHGKGVPLIVDSTTSTPYLLNPIQYGADVVVHSTSKYINGSGDAISGIIIDSGNFSWSPERYPGMKEYKKYGKFAYLVKLRNGIWRNMGGCLAPMNAYLNIIGMETLGLRMERACDNAMQLAAYLETIPGISVNYPGLASSPWNGVAKQLLNGRFGAILTIRVGSKERAFAIMNALTIPQIVSNIGDTKTLIVHPESTLAAHSTEQEKIDAAVFDDMIRISVGIEDIEDLKQDFTAAIQNTVG